MYHYSKKKNKFRHAFQKKTVNFGTLAQKVGGGLASIPILFYILIGTNTTGEGGQKVLVTKNAINFSLPCSSFMDFRMI